MKVLVIGGAGYIGSHCVRQLIHFGHQPVVLDNLVFGHRESIPEKVPFYNINIANEEKVRAVLREEKINIVMHFAAYFDVGESVRDPLKYYFNNVVATLNLLRAMLAEGVYRFVFSSSCATYGVPESLPIVETNPQFPVNPYGQTKLDVENILKSLAHANGLSFASFRYFNAAGASEDAAIGEDHSPETHLIPLSIQVAQGICPQLTVFGTDYDISDGTCLRDYAHVDDLSRAHILSFDKLEQPGTAHFYNLGTGKPTSVKEIIDCVEKISGKKVNVVFSERRPGDPTALYADASKAKQELNWRLHYETIEPIIESAWRWHEKHPKGYSELAKYI